MTREPWFPVDLVVYWCPICRFQTSGSWHSLRDGGLFPQNDTEHDCVRVVVEPSVWNLCCVCGVVAVDALWTYWHPNLDEDTKDERPWVPARPGEEDPMARCPACEWEHRDTDDGSGFYTGTLAAMQAQREADEPEYADRWAEHAQAANSHSQPESDA